ncbi:hypothetical protein D9Q98_003931 [Chlorella vulgaris]|uniref:Nucleotide-diphospho-sugar transferase domain-containing protein n=1 Tax=Chlorella vulgaris TaxID=3077 RepID=A0A9D4TR05_CHLVU|nr:hypothetical protein D9Q98_003931 [Chlorella vulgaris]
MLVLTQIFGKTAWQSATSVRVSMASSRPTSLNLWPGTIPMEYPSRVTFEQIQADPSLPERDASVLAEFQAAPWLLPPRTKALSYAGMHQLDMLAEHRSMPIGNLTRAVVVMLFSRNISVIAQNTIYSMVKFGGVRNYIVAAWDPDDLQACMDLNLPCADVTSLLPVKLEQAANPNAHDELVIKWMRTIVTANLVEQNYAVICSDADVAWTMKPVWESFIGFAAFVDADGVMPELGLNGGAFMVLPTPLAVAFMSNWSASALDAINQGVDNYGHLHHDFAKYDAIMKRCVNPGHCGHVRHEHANSSMTAALFYAYPIGHRMVSDDYCLIDNPSILLDFCDWAILHVHPPCTPLHSKDIVFKRQGLWLMDDTAGCFARNSSSLSNAHDTIVCQPLGWRLQKSEEMFYSCPEYGTALVHKRPNRLSAAVIPSPT